MYVILGIGIVLTAQAFAAAPAQAPRTTVPGTVATTAPPPLLLENIERVPAKALPPSETEEDLPQFRRDVQRQWKKCLQLNDQRVIQAKGFRTSIRELCVETSRRTHHLLLISKNWKQFYQRAQQQFAWYRFNPNAEKKTSAVDIRLLPLSMVAVRVPGEFYFPVAKKIVR